MCKQYEEHHFIITNTRLAITEDNAGFRCWRHDLLCVQCGYTDVDYVFRKLAPDERKVRRNRGRPRKVLPAYLRRE